MKQLLCLVVLLLLAGSVFGQPFEGPFGLKMGLTLEQLKEIDPDIVTMEDNSYLTTKVPKPHPRFDGFFLYVSPTTGLCRIMAIAETIETNSQGIQLRSEYTEIRDAVTKKYGTCKEMDFVYPGSIFDDPQFFMMSLQSKERVLRSDWDAKSGASLPESLASIRLVIMSQDALTGSLGLQYEFENNKAFEEELTNKLDSSF